MTITKAAHTAGPWEMHPVGLAQGHFFISRAGIPHGWIADIGPHPIDDASERTANARLIAAAPELLESSEAVEKILAPFVDAKMSAPHMIEAVQALRAAIAKATGAA